MRIMGRAGDGDGPRESIFEVTVRPSEMLFRPDIDEAQLACSVIIMLEGSMTSGRTTDSTDVDDVRIIRFGRYESTFARPGKCILSKGYRTVFAGTGDTDAGVILLGRINPVGKLSVKIHTVELGRTLVVNAGPALPSIETDTGPSVIALDHSSRIFRIDPKIMIVSMGSSDFLETGPPIARFPHL